MNIKPLLLVVLASVSAAVWAADVPKIDDKRIDIIVEQYEATGGKVPPEQMPNARKQILLELQ